MAAWYEERKGSVPVRSERARWQREAEEMVVI